MAGYFKFTFEQFAMVLSKIEACLNSRLIYSMTVNPNNLVASTRRHFLIGSPFLAPAEPEILNSLSSTIHNWQRLKSFTKRFVTDGKGIISTNSKIA